MLSDEECNVGLTYASVIFEPSKLKHERVEEAIKALGDKTVVPAPLVDLLALPSGRKALSDARQNIMQRAIDES